MFGPHQTLLAERAAALRALGPEPRWWRLFARRRWHARHRAIMAMDVSTMAWLLRQEYPATHINDLANRHSLTGSLVALKTRRIGTWVEHQKFGWVEHTEGNR